MHGVAFLNPLKTGNLSAHYDHPALSRSRRHRERDFGMSVLTESRQIRLRLPNVGQRLQFGSDGPRLRNEATSRERLLLLRGKELYENVGIFGSRVSHRIAWRGVAMRTVACPEVFELSDQVAIPLAGKPRYVTLT